MLVNLGVYLSKEGLFDSTMFQGSKIKSIPLILRSVAYDLTSFIKNLSLVQFDLSLSTIPF